MGPMLFKKIVGQTRVYSSRLLDRSELYCQMILAGGCDTDRQRPHPAEKMSPFMN